MVRIGRCTPLQVPDADREEERADEARLSPECFLGQGIRRADREGAEESRAQQPNEHHRVPRVPEERRNEPPDEEREPREERPPRVLEREGIIQHRIPAEVPTRLERKDRKSTRLNSSHANISYAVFCL